MQTKSTEEAKSKDVILPDTDSHEEYTDPMVSMLRNTWRVTVDGIDLWNKVQLQIPESHFGTGNNTPEPRSSGEFPTCDLTKCAIQPEALKLLSGESARKLRALPVRREGNRLWVAMVDPAAVDIVDSIRMESRCLVQPMWANAHELERAIKDSYGVTSGLSEDSTNDGKAVEYWDSQITDLTQNWQIDVRSTDILERVHNEAVTSTGAQTGVVQIQAGRFSVPVPVEARDFAVYLSGNPTESLSLTRDQEAALTDALKSGAVWAKQVLVNAYQSMAESVAREFQGQALSHAELSTEAMRALEIAVTRFDHRGNEHFAVFADTVIRRILTMSIDTRIYSEDTSVTFVDLKSVVPQPAALESISESTAHRYQVLPLKRAGNQIWVAMSNTVDQEAIAAIQRESNTEVFPLVANHRALKEAITASYGVREPPPPRNPPTAIGAPGSNPQDNLNEILQATVLELRSLRTEVAALRGEVAQLRSGRPNTVPRPVTTRLFPFAPDPPHRREI